MKSDGEDAEALHIAALHTSHNITHTSSMITAQTSPCCVVAHRIDCAGILKLRNSDIELRKGETDIGRKNTRVRMVFRIHVHQATGRTLSLQVASNPIECCECLTSDIDDRLIGVNQLLGG